MIIYKNINIFDAKVEALVNPVNCVGVMGRGLAAEFKKRFPENYVEYLERYKNGLLSIGSCSVTNTSIPYPKYIFNFPTKDDWRDSSRIKYISAGLLDLAFLINYLEVISIAIPALGCGLGGLFWPDVRAEIELHLRDSQAEIWVIPPV